MTDLPKLLDHLEDLCAAATPGKRLYINAECPECHGGWAAVVIGLPGQDDVWASPEDTRYLAALDPAVVRALLDVARALCRIQEVDSPPDYGVTRQAWDAGTEALTRLHSALGGRDG